MAARIVFLDRDGVINRSPGDGAYVTSVRRFRFLPNAKRAIRLLTEAGFSIVVVSNQSCVGQGIIQRSDLDHITDWMLEEIRQAGGDIVSVKYCVHRRDERCNCRKPKSGLLRAAARGATVCWEESFMIGDTEDDMEAGRREGCQTILVLSGKTQAAAVASWRHQPDRIAKDLWDAAQMVVRHMESASV